MAKEVYVPKALLQAYKRRALHRYPLELLEILAGRVTDRGVEVTTLVPVTQLANHDTVIPDDAEFEATIQDIRRAGLTYLGTIHSHTNVADTTPSNQDHCSAKSEGERIFAVLAIERLKSGRRRCHLNFFKPNVPLLHIIT
jgi:hypothetical protein